jgi:hypothetical protein
MSAGSFVYRFFDADDRLLYAGSPESPRTRLRSHLCLGEWLKDIHRVQVQEFATRNAALAEKATALVAEAPMHNLPQVSE